MTQSNGKPTTKMNVYLSDGDDTPINYQNAIGNLTPNSKINLYLDNLFEVERAFRDAGHEIKPRPELSADEAAAAREVPPCIVTLDQLFDAAEGVDSVALPVLKENQQYALMAVVPLDIFSEERVRRGLGNRRSTKSTAAKGGLF